MKKKPLKKKSSKSKAHKAKPSKKLTSKAPKAAPKRAPEPEPEEKKCAFGCGKPVHEGKRLCKHHLEHQRIKMAEYRAARKKKGLCSRCNKKARRMPDGTPSTLCDVCREHVRKLERKNRSQGAQAQAS
jgi:hypothetical protein